MGDGPKKLPVIFYRTPGGAEPVREWLNGLPEQYRRTLGHDIGNVEFGWPIGLPLCRSLGGGLWEVRSSLASGREARVLFGFHDGTLFVLHAFIKKTQKTPADDLELARRRLKEVSSWPRRTLM